jgi:hypothetical protein
MWSVERVELSDESYPLQGVLQKISVESYPLPKKSVEIIMAKSTEGHGHEN